MAEQDEPKADAEPDEAQAPVACSACRGTGQVVSHLGGEENLVPCPWCDGGGVRLADHDAQARWRGEAATPAGGAGPEADAADRGGDGGQAA